MKKLLNSIDIAQIEKDGRYVYHIEGWAFFVDQQPFTLQLLGDGQTPIPCTIEHKPRPDLPAVLKDVEIPKAPGYCIQIRDILQVAEAFSYIDLFLCAGGGKKSLLHKESGELQKAYEWATLEYKIDSLEMFRGQIRVTGWAIDQFEQDAVAIVDETGAPIPHKLDRLVRQDVNEVQKLSNKDYKCAFDLRLLRGDIRGKELHLQFSNRYVTKDFVISMKKFDYEQSKRGRLRKALSRENYAQNKARVSETGLTGFYYYLKTQMDPHYASYNLWVKRHRVSKKEQQRQRETHFSYEPLISIVIPLYNTPLPYLEELLESLLGQTYKKLEICLADGSTDTAVGKFLWKKYRREPRLLYKKLAKNEGISANTNAAIALAQGEFLLFADHDDLLCPDALFEIVQALNEKPETDIVYTDEDKITMDGKNYFDPSFKPDFNLDLLRSSNYICHIFAVRRTLLEAAGHLRGEFDGAQDYDLILRCCERTKKIVHIPKVLYHWRSHPASTAENPDSKQYANEAGRQALEEHYHRLGIPAEAWRTSIFGRYRTRYPVQGTPLVSIIIPNKDHVEDLEKCLRSLAEKTTYPHYEILLVENNSEQEETFACYERLQKEYPKLRLLYWAEGFNYAAINNFAAGEAKGEYLLFLNNDVEILSPEWLTEMLGLCQREDVGAVGAKLYYPDRTIQHAGVVIGLGGVAGHIFSGMPGGEYGYGARLISAVDYSAVTAACMMTPTETFQAAGGFDEAFQVAFNDVDYCMKVRAMDKLVVFTPYAELIHYESKSRGKEETAAQLERFHREIQLFEKKWPRILADGDPYYNRNLTLSKGDCSLRQEMAQDHAPQERLGTTHAANDL